VLWLGQEFDSVKIKRTVADRPANRHPLSARWMEEFDLDSRSQGQVHHGKQAHPNVAEIDAESVYVNGSRKHSHRGVQPFALPPTPILIFRITSEKQLRHPFDQGSAVILDAKRYEGSVHAAEW